MAQKGYWVNGTSDSLGEENSLAEDPFRKLDWLKITHKDNQDQERNLSQPINLNLWRSIKR